MNNNARQGQSATREARLGLPAEPASVAEGRAFVRTTLTEWGFDEMREAVVLVASELITNSLLHTDSPPVVHLMLIDGALVRLEIEDESSISPRRRSYASDSTTGRGMILVESMTSRWGTDSRMGGKVVWCEFDLL